MLEEKLEVAEKTFCIICGKEVKDPIFQLCDTEKCIECFRDKFVQVLD